MGRRTERRLSRGWKWSFARTRWAFLELVLSTSRCVLFSLAAPIPQAKVPLDESLSIDAFVGENEERPSGKYHLRGVVHHVGNTAFSGHYTTCAKRALGKDGGKTGLGNGEEWVFFDDRVGTKKSMDYVSGFERNQRNCYMALYELK